jgi:hypothetical protein
MQNYDFNEIKIYSEDSICMALIILLGIIYYIGIFLIPKNFIEDIMNSDTKLVKKWEYNIFVFLPLVNIRIVYIINYQKKEKNIGIISIHVEKMVAGYIIEGIE